MQNIMVNSPPCFENELFCSNCQQCTGIFEQQIQHMVDQGISIYCPLCRQIVREGKETNSEMKIRKGK